VSEDNLLALFHQFRPDGEGVERVFADIPSGDRYLARLRAVYAITCGEGWANDLYFNVRPLPAWTSQELRSIGLRFVTELRGLAARIGGQELSAYLSRVSDVEVASHDQLDRHHVDNLLVHETVGDWLIGVTDWADPVARLREAYYGIACDYWLANYLSWPYFERWHGPDAFQPYFELWRRGVACGFQGPRLRLAAHEPHR
jgi:hypothetical protein